MSKSAVKVSKDGYRITDEFNDSFIIEKYTHKKTNENRVRLYWETEEDKHNDYFNEQDIAVDLPEAVFEQFCLNYQ